MGFTPSINYSFTQVPAHLLLFCLMILSEESTASEVSRHSVHGAPGQAVDDAGFPLMLPDDAHKRLELVPGLLDRKIEIWPIKAGCETNWPLKIELRQYFFSFW